MAECETAPCKIAGFFHELILMNYGAIRLTPEYLQAAHAVCREHDIRMITIRDLIQHRMQHEGLVQKAAEARRLGADVAVDATTEDFEAVAKAEGGVTCCSVIFELNEEAPQP